jgi:predicted RecA/RadA family phage recombinase
VEASGGVALITLEAGKDASISKPTTVSAPWTKSLRIASGTEVYLTAANPTQTGSLTCSITLDKIPWKTQTTHAPRNGVACAGIVP